MQVISLLRGNCLNLYKSNHRCSVCDISEFENGSWNFESLIDLDENIVSKTKLDIPGVTSPWLYFGSLFATFCWHVEDQSLYSMNYLHTGAKKIWYLTFFQNISISNIVVKVWYTFIISCSLRRLCIIF